MVALEPLASSDFISNDFKQEVFVEISGRQLPASQSYHSLCLLVTWISSPHQQPPHTLSQQFCPSNTLNANVLQSTFHPWQFVPPPHSLSSPQADEPNPVTIFFTSFVVTLLKGMCSSLSQLSAHGRRSGETFQCRLSLCLPHLQQCQSFLISTHTKCHLSSEQVLKWWLKGGSCLGS